MNRQASGFTASQFIVAVVVVVAVAGVGFYFFSDVFRTKVDAQVKQLKDWTPENIAKDPENYLNFCEKQTKDALQSLRANEISVAQSSGSLDGMRQKSKGKLDTLEPALQELKDSYTKTEASQSWPMSWQNKTLDKEAAKRQIVAWAKAIEGEKTLLSKVDAGMKQLDAQKIRIQDAKAKAQGQLTEIETSRQMLKVQKITDELTDRLVSMKGALQATITVATDTSSGIISAEEFVAKSAPTVSDAEFERIMGGSATTQP